MEMEVFTQTVFGHQKVCTLRGLNFAGFKFCGFRRFRKNREIKFPAKNLHLAIRKIKSSQKFLKNKTNPFFF